MKKIHISILLVFVSAMIFGCKQEDVNIPECECECDDGGSSVDYGYTEGKTFKLAQWDDVFHGETDAPELVSIDLASVKSNYDLGNFDEIRTLFMSGSTADPQFLVIPYVSKLCATCHYMTEDIVDNLNELEDAGAVFVAAASTYQADISGTMTDEEVIDELMSDVLIDSDHWSPDRLRMVDKTLEDGIAGTTFPYIFIIRLSDMKIISANSSDTRAQAILAVMADNI